MEKRQDFDHSKLEGVDIDIEISLKECGIAWVEDEDEILFYYGVKYAEDEWYAFDFCTVDKNLDIKEEYSWADFGAVSKYIDYNIHNLTLVEKIIALNDYYGWENVFGSSYWEGLSYNDI